LICRDGWWKLKGEMGIMVNKQARDWVEGETVTQLLLRMKYTYPLVAVRIDGRLVDKSDYDKQTIPDDSRVEVLHLMSGG
jgi:thiamine biosynthesis protein ThiS